MQLSSVSPNRVTIAWDPPADDGGRPAVNYVYEDITPSDEEFDGNCEYHSGDRDLWPEGKCFLLSANQRTLTFSNLEPGASYKFRVRVETTYINSDWAVVDVHLPAASDLPETAGVTEDLQVRVSPASLTVNEGRGEVSYMVRLNKAPAEGETVRLDWDMDSSDYDFFVTYADDATFVFDSTNWSSGFTLTVSAAEDRDSENGIAIMRHAIAVGDRTISGPDVRIEERDND